MPTLRLLCLPWAVLAWLIPAAVGDVFDNDYARRMVKTNG